MAQNPLIKRYLDAGMAFTQMTQARAEAIVKDLVKTGEVQAAKTEELVNQILERSRRNTERLLDLVRKEVQNQIAAMGLATQADIARIEARLDAPGKQATKKQAAGKKRPAKKAAKKKSTAKKASAKKSSAKKSTGS